MTWRHGVLLAWLTLAAGCGSSISSEGGIVGSGLTAVSGNVVSVDPTLRPSVEGATVPPVSVTIAQLPEISDTTDDEGNFELLGEFSGPITLRFVDERVGREVGSLDLDVPARSAVVLQDVEVGAQVRSGVARQLDFFGRVSLVDCMRNDGVLLVDDEGAEGDRHQFLVHIVAETDIVRRDGQPVTCADIAVGDPVAVDGIIRLRGDRTIEAERLTVSPGPQPTRPTIRELTIRGLVQSTDCAAEAMLVRVGRAEEFVQRVRLLAETRFIDADGHRVRCGAVRVGQAIRVDGLLRLDQPRVLNAVRVVIPTPGLAAE